MSKKNWCVWVILVVFYAVMMRLGITCPIRFLTGVSCAGCGMTRAWMAVARLDLASAFSYHPLFWLPIPGAVVLLLRKKLPKALSRGLLAGCVALFLVVYVLRLFSGEDSVVVFAPREGFFWRLAASIWH